MLLPIDRSLIYRVMSQSSPPDYRRPRNRDWWNGFLQLCGSFLADVSLAGQRVLDLGPGHYHFEILLSTLRANVVAIERDPALARLGELLGFSVVQKDAWHTDSEVLGGPFDGVFSKFALRAFEARSPEEIASFTRRLDDLLKPEGWGWIAPWNGPIGARPTPLMDAISRSQIESFRILGWEAHELTEDEAELFGVLGVTHNRVLFTKNLERAPFDGRRWSLRRFRRARRFRRLADAIEWDPSFQEMFLWDRDGLRQFLDVLLPPDLIQGCRLLEIGPGLFDFADMCAAYGAEVTHVEPDAELAESGTRRGYRVIHMNPRALTRGHLGGSVDGLFSRGSLNVFEDLTPAAVERTVDRLDSLISPTGWGCIFPRNRSAQPNPRLPEAQLHAFSARGWSCRMLDEEAARSFGLDREAFSRPLFTKGLSLARLDSSIRRRRPVFVVANSPVWRWMSDRMNKLGQPVALSFNARFDEVLPSVSGAILAIACVNGKPVLPRRYHDPWLPIPTGDLARVLDSHPKGVLRGLIADGTEVFLFCGRSEAELDAIIRCFRFDDALDLAAIPTVGRQPNQGPLPERVPGP